MSIRQRGADIYIRWPAASGIRSIDRPNGTSGLERASLVTSSPRNIHFEICADPKSPPGGRYELLRVDTRPARPADRHRQRGEERFHQARAAELVHCNQSSCCSACDESARLYGEAFEAFGHADDTHWRGVTMGRRGRVVFANAQATSSKQAISNARDLYREALDLLDEDEGYRRAEILSHLGVLARMRGELDQAERLYAEATEEALKLESAHVSALLTKIDGNRCKLLFLHRRLEETSSCYLEQLRQWQQQGRVREAQVPSRQLAELYSGLGDTERARAFLEQASAIARQVQDPDGVRKAALLAGKIHLADPRATDHPLRELEAAIAIARANDSLVKWVAVAHNTRGRIYLRRREWRHARAAFEQAKKIYQATDEEEKTAVVELNLASVRDHLGDASGAARAFAKLASFFGARDKPRRQASAEYGRARALMHVGRHHEALATIESALTRVTSIRQAVPGRRTALSFVASKHRYVALKIDILMQLHPAEPSAGHAIEALMTSERNRAQDLWRSLRQSAGAFGDGALHLREDIDRLWRFIDQLEAQARASVDGTQREAIQTTIRDTLIEIDKQEERIAASDPRLRSLRLQHPPTLDQIQQELLDPQTQLLVFALGEERSYVWQIDHDRLRVRPLAARHEIDQLAREVRDQLVARSPLGASLRRAKLEELAHMLLDPIADRLADKRIAIVLDGALHHIPFAVLPDPTTAYRQPLLDTRETVRLPSVSVLVELRRATSNRPRATQRLALFADPVVDRNDERLHGLSSAVPQATPALPGTDHFRRLPQTGNEAQAILDLLPAQDRFAALGFDANLQAVSATDLRSFRYLHFATHGVLNARHPELSGLLLSRYDSTGTPRRGLLRGHHIEALRLDADLVTLSACRTALGLELDGEGLVGMARSFMFAGAPRLLVSLWQVDDRATATLMEELYTGLLRDSLTPAAALRNAQQKLSTAPATSSPYYWAGFVLLGDWRSSPE